MTVVDFQLPFYKLMGLELGSYNLIYRINDNFQINDLGQIRDKKQLLLQRCQSRIQQLNLVLVDTNFIHILGDVAINVLLGNVTNSAGYLNLSERIKITELEDESHFLSSKFTFFSCLLLFSDISSEFPSEAKIDNKRVFVRKIGDRTLEYFSFFEHRELESMLLETMKYKIDFQKSFIRDQELTLCMKIVNEFDCNSY